MKVPTIRTYQPGQAREFILAGKTYNNMYEELKALFGKETPSVRKFQKILNELPPVRRLHYLQLAYKAAFCEWDVMNVRYRLFLTHLFTRDWQRTLNFLLESTVLGTLQFDLQEPEIIQRFIGQLENPENSPNPSFLHLAFSLSLVFPYPWSVGYLGDKLRTQILTSEDLLRLNKDTLLGSDPGDKFYRDYKEAMKNRDRKLR